jgi:uncharacterized membrane protein YwzB
MKRLLKAILVSASTGAILFIAYMETGSLFIRAKLSNPQPIGFKYIYNFIVETISFIPGVIIGWGLVLLFVNYPILYLLKKTSIGKSNIIMAIVSIIIGASIATIFLVHIMHRPLSTEWLIIRSWSIYFCMITASIVFGYMLDN